MVDSELSFAPTLQGGVALRVDRESNVFNQLYAKAAEYNATRLQREEQSREEEMRAHTFAPNLAKPTVPLSRWDQLQQATRSESWLASVRDASVWVNVLVRWRTLFAHVFS